MPAFLVSIIQWFADNPWATALLMVLFVAVSILMVLAILIQRPQGGGLAAAFGGSSAGSGQTALGTKTGDALTIFTISVFLTFVLFGIILNYATAPAPPREPAAELTAPATMPATTPTTTPGTAPAETKPTDAAPVTPAPITPAPADNKPAEPAPANPNPAPPAQPKN